MGCKQEKKRHVASTVNKTLNKQRDLILFCFFRESNEVFCFQIDLGLFRVDIVHQSRA